MNKESRKELAALSFSEKIMLLEKLRDRSLAFAEARKELAEKKKQMQLDWLECDLLIADPCIAGRLLVRGTQIPVEDIIGSYESGASIADIANRFQLPAETVRRLLLFAREHYALTRPL